MSDDRQVAAEREFQARVTALHEARARQAEVGAALNRLAVDQRHLSREEAAARRDLLVAERDRIAAEVQQLHDRARQAHAEFRRLTDVDAEPDQIEPDEPAAGYQQPPFGEWR